MLPGEVRERRLPGKSVQSAATTRGVELFHTASEENLCDCRVSGREFLPRSDEGFPRTAYVSVGAKIRVGTLRAAAPSPVDTGTASSDAHHLPPFLEVCDFGLTSCCATLPPGGCHSFANASCCRTHCTIFWNTGLTPSTASPTTVSLCWFAMSLCALICVHAKSKSTGPTSDRKSTRLNSSHSQISYAVFCLKKKII